jgi:hypothetical protein
VATMVLFSLLSKGELMCMCDIEQKIKLNVKFEENDILQIYKINLKKQFGKNIRFGKLLIGIFVGLILFYILSSILTGESAVSSQEVPDTPLSFLSMLQFIIFVVVILSIVFILPRRLRKEAVKNFKSNKEFQNEIEYIISEDEVSGHSITSEFHHDWSYFIKAVETNAAFVLYLSDNTVICLPKRCFMNNNDVEFVKKMIRDKFQGKKYQYLKVK